MARRELRQVVSEVRRITNATGVPEEVVQEIQAARRCGNPEKYQRVLKRAVTQGYLMRKNNKYYFIPSRSMHLPSLVVMRRRGRRRSRRARRGRSRRRSAGLYLETVMTRSTGHRRRRRRQRRRPAGPGAQHPVQARTTVTASSSLTSTVEKKASGAK